MMMLMQVCLVLVKRGHWWLQWWCWCRCWWQYWWWWWWCEGMVLQDGLARNTIRDIAGRWSSQYHARYSRTVEVAIISMVLGDGGARNTMHGIAGRWSSQYHAWYCGTVELAAKLCRGRRALYLFPPSGTFQLKWLAPDSTTTAASIATNKKTKLPIKPPRSSKMVYFLKQVTSVHTGNNSLGWDRIDYSFHALHWISSRTSQQLKLKLPSLI